MEKEYLIHNIDYKDNPEDQHQTLDIILSNLEVAGQDITATIGIDTFVNGMLTSSNKYEDVSLTSAGGGGGDFSTCTGTVTDESSLNYQLPTLADNDGLEYIAGADNKSGEFEVVLYKGNAVILIDGADSVTTSGNITELMENVAYLITGDFSITMVG